eukprot:TRINITY_DN12607_c0_g1_i1.p1 TRINITY_DN12607_c0_g1~~TRINITY_DN12607_c0_g1_i1.p1  ORF type:complete len:360 (-),score=56.27 TRINITY_DN12607_c0_g1_i1:75-1130(-)
MRIPRLIVPRRDFSVSAVNNLFRGSLRGKIDFPKIGTSTENFGFSTFNLGYEHLHSVGPVIKSSLERNLSFFQIEDYGHCVIEKAIGESIKTCDRDDLLLACTYVTRLRHFRKPHKLMQSAKESLTRLGIDQFDLYQVNGGLNLCTVEEMGDALAELLDTQKTRAVGVSNYSFRSTMRMYDYLKNTHGIQLASYHFKYNIWRKFPSEIVEACNERDIKMLAYNPLGVDGNLNYVGAQFWRPDDDITIALNEIAWKRNVGKRAIALNYIISKGIIPLPSTLGSHHVKSNLEALSFKLTEKEIKNLEVACEQFASKIRNQNNNDDGWGFDLNHGGSGGDGDGGDGGGDGGGGD